VRQLFGEYWSVSAHRFFFLAVQSSVHVKQVWRCLVPDLHLKSLIGEKWFQPAPYFSGNSSQSYTFWYIFLSFVVLEESVYVIKNVKVCNVHLTDAFGIRNYK
jgi:hypothetical protein